ncbi:hypothetical protein B0H16DRAFT_1715883 [Mycena metata]|uniref:Uncharacterized protein n=1 Tax=Mycena metata TaxID=1033252 RepID=A0AAD7JQN7_9AGAR|nr:hypothetical protein B0H16DRAFT_1715883 [Mycena metata]
MFPNSASLVALVLAALAAFLHVSDDAASDAAAKKAAEAGLVKKLRLAPLATDRIALLSTDDQVLRSTSSTPPQRPPGTNSAMAAGLLDACSINTPGHTHTRATEMQFSVNGTICTGMITENTSRFILTELPIAVFTLCA